MTSPISTSRHFAAEFVLYLGIADSGKLSARQIYEFHGLIPCRKLTHDAEIRTQTAACEPDISAKVESGRWRAARGVATDNFRDRLDWTLRVGTRPILTLKELDSPG